MVPAKWFVVVLLGAGVGTAAAADKPVQTGKIKGITAELIADTGSVQPGKPFTVGLTVSHDETFHTYWKNPGIVGVPFGFTWTLPPGFSAGPIQWPVPEQVMMFHYPAYGYERDIVLLTDITPPEGSLPEKVTLEVQASWMACGATCHPGSHRFSLTLPRAGESASPVDPSLVGVFSAARKELPASLQGWEVRVESAVDDSRIRLRLRRSSKGAKVDPEGCVFFSSDGQISSTPEQVWSREADGSLLMVAERSKHGPAEQRSLPGVLYCPSGWGNGGAPKYMQVNPAVSASP